MWRNPELQTRNVNIQYEIDMVEPGTMNSELSRIIFVIVANCRDLIENVLQYRDDNHLQILE